MRVRFAGSGVLADRDNRTEAPAGHRVGRTLHRDRLPKIEKRLGRCRRLRGGTARKERQQCRQRAQGLERRSHVQGQPVEIREDRSGVSRPLARLNHATHIPRCDFRQLEIIFMTTGFVFEAGSQKAITKEADGSNLPTPKLGPWKFLKKISDVNKAGLTGFDPAIFERQGYQIWPAPGGVLAEQDVLGDKNILR